VRGTSLYRKASFLLDRLGEPVFAPLVRIHEQPHLKGALGSAPFDDEGVATRARDLVTGGVLQGYVLDSYSARKLGLRNTGNSGGVRNLTLEPGSDDFPALLKRMGTGLLVTELIGFGVNNVTGDYSRGAAGFWVEGGEIRHPVEEFTIAGNLKDMFRTVAAVGNDVDTRGNIRSGSILIESMIIAGS
jgi:PmbA protein